MLDLLQTAAQEEEGEEHPAREREDAHVASRACSRMVALLLLFTLL